MGVNLDFDGCIIGNYGKERERSSVPNIFAIGDILQVGVRWVHRDDDDDDGCDDVDDGDGDDDGCDDVDDGDGDDDGCDDVDGGDDDDGCDDVGCDDVDDGDDDDDDGCDDVGGGGDDNGAVYRGRRHPRPKTASARKEGNQFLFINYN